MWQLISFHITSASGLLHGSGDQAGAQLVTLSTNLWVNGAFDHMVKDSVKFAWLAGQPRASFIRTFLQTYRATPHPAMGVSPFKIMGGVR